MQRLLNTNPEICIPPETSLIPLLYLKYRSKKKWNTSLKRRFSKDVLLDKKIEAWWELDEKQIFDALVKEKIESYQQAIRVVYQCFAYNQHKTSSILGDKNPANTLYIDKIGKLFPNAKFIAIVRDPVDNVNSFMNVTFDSDDPKILAHRWNFYNQHLVAFREKASHNFHILKYEDLVSNTTQSLTEIANFLKIEDNFSVENKETGKYKWQSNLSKDISNNHIGKGSKNLSNNNVAYIQSICGDTGLKLNYSFDKKPTKKLVLSAFIFNRIEKWFINLPLFLSAFILNYYRNKKKVFDNE